MDGLSILTIPPPDNMCCANESIFLVAYNIHRERERGGGKLSLIHSRMCKYFSTHFATFKFLRIFCLVFERLKYLRKNRNNFDVRKEQILIFCNSSA